MQKSYNGVALPQGGEAIQYANGKFRCRITPSSRSSKATAPAAISGEPRSVSSTLPWRRRMAASAAIAWFEIFAGEKAYRNSRTGCRMIP